MLDELACTCEGEGCQQVLGEDERVLVFENGAGERRAYECDCGAVTITVHR